MADRGAEHKTELADQRTSLSSTRTKLVVSRVLSGWTKVGFSFLAASLGMTAYSLSDDANRSAEIFAITLAVGALIAGLIVMQRAWNSRDPRLSRLSRKTLLRLLPATAVSISALVLISLALGGS